MGRLKARTATSQVDRDLHTRLARAQRELEAARDICIRVARDRNLSAVQRARATEARHKAASALALVDSIGHLSGRTDREDPDLMPETDKRPRREQPERFGDEVVI